MSFLPLNLGIRQTLDAGKGAAKSSPPSKTQVEKALQHDDYTCRFCGFRDKKYQRAVSYSEDGKHSSFVTACTFCEQCLTLERAGLMSSGVLIWLPEMSQAELNHTARSIYVARASEGPMAESAARAFDVLKARHSDAKKRLGTDDPLLLATVLHESLTAEEAKQGISKMEGIRLLPFDKHIVRGRQGTVDQFPKFIAYWRSSEGPYGRLPVEKWAELFKNTAASVGNA